MYLLYLLYSSIGSEFVSREARSAERATSEGPITRIYCIYCICIYVSIYCIYVCIYVCIYCIYVYIRVFTVFTVFVFTYVRMYKLYVYTVSTYVYTYVYTVFTYVYTLCTVYTYTKLQMRAERASKRSLAKEINNANIKQIR